MLIYIKYIMLTEIQKFEIIVLSNSGKSIRSIAKTMNINKNTVAKWILRYKQCGNLKRKVGSGFRNNQNSC
jgi:transposase